MRLVIAVVRPAQVEAVRLALAAVHVTRLTVCDGQGAAFGARAGITQQTVLQVAVNEDFLARTVDTIRSVLAAAPEGPGGDDGGGLFVLPMSEAVQIYREVRGPEAV
ncbi:MAG: P-II family nitrogen regulator [Planctomycetia bacterium]